ncbi:hypothetical protein [Massilia terrae]|uniref:Uncharacterized protein n=1 Tax=Massilia terrae TaxID=1811224 RepID=A0ABT2CXL3_9BURK|nr:hypothetical protein [Massilia terrae]MCS0658726.1 hypothetical protein [Massilia terrae]
MTTKDVLRAQVMAQVLEGKLGQAYQAQRRRDAQAGEPPASLRYCGSPL